MAFSPLINRTKAGCSIPRPAAVKTLPWMSAAANGAALTARTSTAHATFNIRIFASGLQGFQHFVVMIGNLYFGENVRDLALVIDKEGCALDAHVFSAIHGLLFPYAI